MAIAFLRSRTKNGYHLLAKMLKSGLLFMPRMTVFRNLHNVSIFEVIMRKMNPIEPGFDPVQFPRLGSWQRRVNALLERLERESEFGNPFLEANSTQLRHILSANETKPRMVVNISADALLGFIKDGQYKNAYERPVIAGASGNSGKKQAQPSKTRQEVDGLLGFGNKAKLYYFGAVALGGTGIRFYGEYCMVLNNDVLSNSTSVFDRNSYDLVRPPLVTIKDKKALVRCLRGKWTIDLVQMLTIKILPKIIGIHRLITAGAASDAILHDEDFLEVHLKRKFGPAQVYEVRISPEDEVLKTCIRERLTRGILPTASELLWCSRRARVERELDRLGIRARIVTAAGRGNRWR